MIRQKSTFILYAAQAYNRKSLLLFCLYRSCCFDFLLRAINFQYLAVCEEIENYYAVLLFAFPFLPQLKIKSYVKKAKFHLLIYAIDYHLSKFLTAQLNDRNNNTRWSHKTVITRGLIACTVLDSKLGEPARTNCAVFNIVHRPIFFIFILL